MSLLRIDPEAVRREAEKLTRELRQQAPRQYAPGGIVRRPISLVLDDGEMLVAPNGKGEPVPTPRFGVVDRRKVERARAESCGQTAPFLGPTASDAAANLRAKLGHCPHGLAEEVVLITGEVVAAVCPTCWGTLPASFVGSEWKP